MSLDDRDLERLLSAVPAAEPPPELLARLLAEIPTETELTGAARRPRRWRTWRAAAVLAGVVGGGWLVLQLRSVPLAPVPFVEPRGEAARAESPAAEPATPEPVAEALEDASPPAAPRAALQFGSGDSEHQRSVRQLSQEEEISPPPEQRTDELREGGVDGATSADLAPPQDADRVGRKARALHDEETSASAPGSTGQGTMVTAEEKAERVPPPALRRLAEPEPPAATVREVIEVQTSRAELDASPSSAAASLAVGREPDAGGEARWFVDTETATRVRLRPSGLDTSVSVLEEALDEGRLPPVDEVRLEGLVAGLVSAGTGVELGDDSLGLAVEGAPSPWSDGRRRHLLRFAVVAEDAVTDTSETAVEVRFDPRVVARWRLLGYEPRPPRGRSAPADPAARPGFGYDGSATVVFEVELRADAPRGGTVAALAVGGRRQALFESDLATRLTEASPAMQLVASVVELAELLRGSPLVPSRGWDDARRRADDLRERFPDDPEVERVAELVRRAAVLATGSAEWQ